MKPITLHPFEVEAALRGELRQIRRPIVPQVPFGMQDSGVFTQIIQCADGKWYAIYEDLYGVGHIHVLFGPGATIWGRETWRNSTFQNSMYKIGFDDWARFSWLPPVTMPKYMSRITLMVKAVRVERLQEMSEADATRCGGMYLINYADRWDKHYAKRGYGWDTNPWGWIADVDCEVKK